LLEKFALEKFTETFPKNLLRTLPSNLNHDYEYGNINTICASVTYRGLSLDTKFCTAKFIETIPVRTQPGNPMHP